ncbi:MAG TPA: VWA domain-containing protein, partial [Burkholderiales bacterium]|nr:VWA domain-containing protein [Burkholderiales bacterium]
IPFLFWFAGRHGRLARRHLRVATTLRALAIACMALALMRPQWTGSSSDVSVVYALDVSRSVSPAFVESAIEWIGRADREGEPGRSRYVAFADHAVTFDDAQAIRSLAVSDGRPRRSDGQDAVDRSATNIERALDAALLQLDASRAKRIVLLTDGNQTNGDLWRALPRLLDAGIRVFPVEAKVNGENDAWVAGVDVPPGLHAGEPVEIVVRVIAVAGAAAQVSLKHGRSVLGTRKVALQPGVNRIAFDARLPAGGAVSLTAEVLADGDAFAENNRMHRTVWVEPRPRVLYVEGGSEGTPRYLAAALAEQDFDVHLLAPADIPASAAGFAAIDAIVLSDVPAKAMSAESMRAIESYVRDQGGGLLFAAGENVHGEQGYSDTAVERVLPVEFKAQEKHKDLTMVVVLDRSYSMKGRKMEMAKEATRAALDLLEEQHRFAVVAFDSQTYIAVPMQFVRSRRKAEDQISRIQASGQTNIYPALGIVYRMMQKVESKAKHVILLSDGDTQPADFETLVKRMAAEKMVVSTVAVGADADRDLMRNIAKWGKGRTYYAENADSIPQIFIQETERAVGANLLEESFHPEMKQRSAAFRGLDARNLPDLKGVVSSKARTHAEVLLATPSNAPLLVRWQYGLGTAVAFTSDVKNRWSPDWIKWPGYGKFWAQQVSDLMRRDSGESLDFEVARDGEEAVIQLSALAADGSFRGDLAPRVKITRPDGGATTVALRQVGPGRYEARLPLDRRVQPARFELAESPGMPLREALRAGTRELHEDFADEYRALPVNTEMLEALAAATGGKTNPSVAEIFARQADESRVTRALWAGFAAAGLLFYLLDIAVRRSPWAWRLLGSRP